MKVGGLVRQGCVLALFSAVAAWGQSHLNGIYLTSPLGVSWGYDDNFVANSQRLDDTITLLTGPTFAWDRTTHQSTFSIDYRPEFEFFSRNTNLDAWNHASNMRFSRRLNGRTTFDAGNSFMVTSDSSSELQNSLVLLPYGRFLQNTFFADVRYRIDHATRLTFRFDNALTTMDLPGDLKGRLNEVGSAGTVSLDRDLTSRQSVSVNYSFLHVDPLNRQTGGSSTNVNLLLAGYAFQVNPTLLLRVTAGGIAGSESAFSGSAAVEKQFDGIWVAAGYQRYLGFFTGLAPLQRTTPDLTPFANGLVPNSIYQVFSLRASGQLTRHIGLEGVAQRAFNSIDGRGAGVRSLIGQLKVTYRLNRRWALFVRAEHYGQNLSQFSDQALARNRYIAGVEFALSKPPEKQGARDRRATADSEEAKQPDHQLPEEKQFQ
jgi:hypothetical protein